MPLDLKKIKYNRLGFFRFKKLNDKYLLTSDNGEYILLTEKEFEDFAHGKLEKDKEPYLSLVKRNFVWGEVDLTEATEKYRHKKGFLFAGPSLHIIVVTLRCNHQCVYCHASARGVQEKEMDMTKDVARQVVDKIFQTTSHFIAIEFQGGEPLLNWPVVKFILEYAQEKNKKIGKDLQIRLVSNMSLMTEGKFKYLLDKGASLCTSIDGPRKLQNMSRPMVGGDSYKNAAKWARRFFTSYPKLEKKGYVSKMAGLLTISRFSLPYWKEIVNEYVKLGFDNITLRVLNPFGFSQHSWSKIAYSADDFLEFYKKAVLHIIKLNLKGKKFKENIATQFLTKIFTDHDPNHLDFRSPCGAGIGQLAYNYNGNVYTCDEGRMLSMMDDESFKLGNVEENSYQEIVGNPIVRTVCVASCLEGLAGCSDCVYKPYCGVCPIYNYFAQGNLFGQMPTNERCKINKGILDFLFERIQDPKIRDILETWPRKR